MSYEVVYAKKKVISDEDHIRTGKGHMMLYMQEKGSYKVICGGETWYKVTHAGESIMQGNICKGKCHIK